MSLLCSCRCQNDSGAHREACGEQAGEGKSKRGDWLDKAGGIAYDLANDAMRQKQTVEFLDNAARRRVRVPRAPDHGNGVGAEQGYGTTSQSTEDAYIR